jgi:hypothetical protein
MGSYDSSSLNRIFHTDRDEEAAKANGAPPASGSDRVNEGNGLRQQLYVSYCPRSNSKLTQYPSGVRKPQQNRYEIGG